MKVTEKKLDDGRILLEAVASTAEVSHALTAAQYRFAQQMGVQPTPGMSVEQAVEKQLGIKDLDAIVQQQAVEYLVPFAIDKRNITPAFPALPKAAGPLKRGQTFSFEVRVTPKPDYELKSYEPVSITVPPFEIEQAEVEEQIAQIDAQMQAHTDFREIEALSAQRIDLEQQMEGKMERWMELSERKAQIDAYYRK